jgi:hypothetical protein
VEIQLAQELAEQLSAEELLLLLHLPLLVARVLFLKEAVFLIKMLIPLIQVVTIFLVMHLQELQELMIKLMLQFYK